MWTGRDFDYAASLYGLRCNPAMLLRRENLLRQPTSLYCSLIWFLVPLPVSSPEPTFVQLSALTVLASVSNKIESKKPKPSLTHR